MEELSNCSVRHSRVHSVVNPKDQILSIPVPGLALFLPLINKKTLMKSYLDSGVRPTAVP